MTLEPYSIYLVIGRLQLNKLLEKQRFELSKNVEGNFREIFRETLDFWTKKDTQEITLECLETLI